MAAIDEFPFLSSLPVGCGFRPTEEELITHYLKNKILGQEFLVRFIKEIDLYKFDPEQLPDKSYFPSSNFEWFFFRANTSNNKRTTATGGWRSTGDPRRIKARETNEVIATCHIYVFHRGKGGNAIKTNWVIHEYKLHTLTDITSQPFIIFRLKKNAEERHVSIRDQEDGQNSTVASHRTKKVKRGGEIREVRVSDMNILKRPYCVLAKSNFNKSCEVPHTIQTFFKVKRDKLDKKAEVGIFVRYNTISKDYRVFQPHTSRVIVSQDVHFAGNEQ
ncbi:NAC domain-containing protein 40-like [Cucurbita pepo subsp. pepo]|uniref:NAC domain-containing protein 40-like n=1 Tax=Cucurbita pepo subsp. pepo TaxID=3664 RepID=UPI000C9D2798|nr:NAC domain-containing protein 40-like [Cucurbita pepo subsp. pepo]